MLKKRQKTIDGLSPDKKKKKHGGRVSAKSPFLFFFF